MSSHTGAIRRGIDRGGVHDPPLPHTPKRVGEPPVILMYRLPGVNPPRLRRTRAVRIRGITRGGGHEPPPLVISKGQ